MEICLLYQKTLRSGIQDRKIYIALPLGTSGAYKNTEIQYIIRPRYPEDTLRPYTEPFC
jgi:hypothetical protein